MFNPHCNYSIEVQDQVMLCTMAGAWNIEGALQYFAEVKQEAEPLLSNKWCRITETEEFEGGPEEILQVLKDIQDWSLAHNCIRLFIVAPRALNKMILDKNKQAYSQVELADTTEQAIEMAKALLNK